MRWIWRATPALDRGAYLMQQDAPVERMIRLLQRETMYHEDMAWQS